MYILLLYLQVSCREELKNKKERILEWDTNQKPKDILSLGLWWLFEYNKRIKKDVQVLAQVWQWHIQCVHHLSGIYIVKNQDKSKLHGEGVGKDLEAQLVGKDGLMVLSK